MRIDFHRVRQFFGVKAPSPEITDKAVPPGVYHNGPSTEGGLRPTPENMVHYLYRQMQIDYGLRACILDIRHMDRLDGRVKKIHGRMSRTAIKGGLQLATTSDNTRIIREWDKFTRRLALNRREKLESDCRGLVMEGNLPMQWVLDADHQVVAGIRMPSETIAPRVGGNGRFLDPAQAYDQHNLFEGRIIHTFPLWQLSLVRLAPDNVDDLGCMGRPYLDATRSVWKKLMMTEEDLVIRRRVRAPLRMAHVLEGASEDELETYRQRVEDESKEITTDYFMNRKGGVSPVQGDTNLDQIADVSYLLDTFFAGGPAPKGLFGYSDELQRDVLEDLKRDYFDEIDSLQDTLSYVYELGFRLQLLLKGIDPDNYDFSVQFAERRTDTPNQRADLSLKYQALGVPHELVWRTAGLDPVEVKRQRIAEAKERDPYPDDLDLNDDEDVPSGRPRVSITPGNGRKGDSATTISTRS